MSEARITVLLVDDHALVRRGFRRLLEDDSSIEVVAEAGDGQEAVELALLHKPQVVVMDFALPSMNGAEFSPMMFMPSSKFSSDFSLLPS